MLFVASHSLRSHLRLFVGTIITVAAAVAIATSCALLLDSGLHDGARPERLAGVPIVVQHRQTISVRDGRGDDAKTETVTAEERARLDLREADRLAQLPGVAAVVPDRSFRAVLLGRSGRPVNDDRPSWGHPWANAPLTPFTLVSGRPPADPGEVVVDAGLARRAGVRVGDRTSAVIAGATRDVAVVGIARPPAGDELATQAALFLDDDSASRAYGHTGEVDEFGLLLRPGADRAAIRERRARATPRRPHRGRARARGVPQRGQRQRHAHRHLRSGRRHRPRRRRVRHRRDDRARCPAAAPRSRAPACDRRNAASASPHDRTGDVRRVAPRRRHRRAPRHPLGPRTRRRHAQPRGVAADVPRAGQPVARPDRGGRRGGGRSGRSTTRGATRRRGCRRRRH